MPATVINLAEARSSLQVVRVMAETRDAYSRAAYGEIEWATCAAFLLGEGHSVEITAALLCSRLMRWARESADYDAPTCADLATFLNTPAGVNALSYELAA